MDDLTNKNERLDGGELFPVVANDNPNFDAARNQRIMDEVMANNLKTKEAKLKNYQEGIEERADTLSTFFTSDFFKMNQSRSPLDYAMKRYFGPREHEHLTGQMQRLEEDPLVVLNKQGDIIREKGFDGTKEGKSKKKSLH